MKTGFLIFCAALLLAAEVIQAQQVIELPNQRIDGVEYSRDERQVYSELWSTTVVSNVSIPSLMVYEPSADRKNGTSVVIAPGGGLYALSINSEGRDVAQ